MYIITAIRMLFLALFLFLVLNGKMMLWLALFAISLVGALLFGRVYCGYIFVNKYVRGMPFTIPNKHRRFLCI